MNERAGDSYIDPGPDSDETLVSSGAEDRVSAAFRKLAVARVVEILAEEAEQERVKRKNQEVSEANQSESAGKPEAAVLEPLSMAKILVSIFYGGPEQVVDRLRWINEDFERALAQPKDGQTEIIQQDYRTFVAVWRDIYKLEQEGNQMVEIQKILTKKYSEGGDNNSPAHDPDGGVGKTGELTDKTGNKKAGDNGETLNSAANSKPESAEQKPLTKAQILDSIFFGGEGQVFNNLETLKRQFDDRLSELRQAGWSTEIAEADYETFVGVWGDMEKLYNEGEELQKIKEYLHQKYTGESAVVGAHDPVQTEVPRAPAVSEAGSVAGFGSERVPNLSEIADKMKRPRKWWGDKRKGGQLMEVNKLRSARKWSVRKVREEGFFIKLAKRGREIYSKNRQRLSQLVGAGRENFSNAVLSQVAKTHLLFVKVRSSDKLGGAVGLAAMGVLAYGVSRYVSDGDGSTDWLRDFSELKLPGAGTNSSFADLGVVAPVPSADHVLSNTYLDGAPSYVGGDVFGEGTGPTGTPPSVTEPAELADVGGRASDPLFNEEDYWPSQPPAPEGEPPQGPALVAEPEPPVSGENVSREVVGPGIATAPEAHMPAHPLGDQPLVPKNGSSLWKLLAERLSDNEIYKTLPLEGKSNVIANILLKLKSLPADKLQEFGLNEDLRVFAGKPINFKEFKPTDMLDILEVAKNRYIK